MTQPIENRQDTEEDLRTMLGARSGELHETSGRFGFRDRLWTNTPLSSVKGRIIIGFGLVTLLLIGVVAGAAAAGLRTS